MQTFDATLNTETEIQPRMTSNCSDFIEKCRLVICFEAKLPLNAYEEMVVANNKSTVEQLVEIIKRVCLP